VGGTTDEEAASLSKEEVVNVADRDTRQTLVREGSLAPEVLGTRLWSKAIPQLEAGHTELLARAQQSLEAARLSNVILGGSYVSGISLPKCADGAYALASQVADELANNRATRKVEERQSMEQKGESEVEQGGEEGGGKAEPMPK
jgi:protoporphyrinogen oxidase